MLRLIKRPEEAGGEKLTAAGYSPQLARLLAMRGVHTPEEARRFLNPSMDDLSEPKAIYGMEAALETIRGAMERGAKIVVYGDYDVDGVCATTILTQALRAHGAKATYRIPSRHSEGYGLNAEAVREIAAEYELLITVDCGITSVAEAALTRELGLKLIVTDHHEPPERLPQADALVDPLLGAGCGRGLCGAGVALKIVQGLWGLEAAEPLVELAALATVADMVPLTGENRAIVSLGLRQLQKTTRPGLREMMSLSGLDGKAVNAGHIGFQIAPRLNAGGRLGDSNRCVEMLLTDDAALGARIARELDETNAERQRLEAAIVREADRQVAGSADFLRDKVLIAVGEGWNRGVVGLAAGRLTEKYAWPSIVFSREDGMCTGSARSVPGVNIHAVLSRCQDLYERFGGHAMAAGLTLKAEYMDEFRRRVNEAAEELAEPDAYIPSVLYDFDLPLREVTCELAEDLGRLAPNGIGNPAPVLAARGVHLLEARAVGAEGRHLKLRLEQDGASVGGIAFGLGGERANLPDTVDAIFSPTINEWMGRRSAEMDVKRLVPHAGLDAFRKGCAAREEAFALYLLQAEAAKTAPVEEEILRAQARQLLEESCQGTLLTVRTLEGALRWADWLAEAGLSDRLDCAFGKPADLRRYNCLCAMPAPGAEEGYRRVIALDDADVEAALRALMPSDDALRNLYRVLRAWPGAMKSEKALSQAAGLSAAATRLGLTAFDELGLVLLSREPFEAVLMPARRCSLSDSPTLKRLRLVCHWEEKA